MEEPQLEKVIEKLEKIDIRAWESDDEDLIVETGGLKFYLKKRGWKNFVDGDKFSYELTVKRANKEGQIQYYYDKTNKGLRDKLEEFYEKTYTALKENQKTELLATLNDFLSD